MSTRSNHNKNRHYWSFNLSPQNNCVGLIICRPFLPGSSSFFEVCFKLRKVESFFENCAKKRKLDEGQFIIEVIAQRRRKGKNCKFFQHFVFFWSRQIKSDNINRMITVTGDLWALKYEYNKRLIKLTTFAILFMH